MTKTPPPPIWLTGRERHTTPPLQPLCNKATKQTKTISLSVSLIVLVHVDRFHEQMACPTTPSINGIYYFATCYLSSSFSSYYYIGSTTVESNSSTTNTKTSGLGLGFFFVLLLLVFSTCSPPCTLLVSISSTSNNSEPLLLLFYTILSNPYFF